MIRFEGVTKIYKGDVKGVEDLTFHCHEGETLALIGTSGCGKTTTLRMINRLVNLTRGKICVDGKDIYDYNVVQLRRSMGYVIQYVGLLPHLTVARNISLVPELEGWEKVRINDRVQSLLHMVGLDPRVYCDRYPVELSGGQQQRVGIARALASDPPILLMDEPFGALDPITRQQLQDEFLTLKKEIKKTIVFVTHDILEAVALADRIAVMNEGRLVQIGTSVDIIENPANQFVSDLLRTYYFQLSLSLIRMEDMMIRNVVTLEEEQEGDFKKKCMGVFRSRRVGSLPVVDPNGCFKGLVTRASLRDTETPVIYDYPVLKTTDTVVIVMDCLKRNPSLEIFPVVTAQGRLKGLVSRKAIRELFTEMI
ncbi:MAG: ABC transporter ATP-binding protein [Thermodesulfobacteriota bacterium]|nr:ABC transporter ATP-binding protein [Thermodesulfobacteriota bacterium]